MLEEAKELVTVATYTVTVTESLDVHTQDAKLSVNVAVDPPLYRGFIVGSLPAHLRRVAAQIEAGEPLNPPAQKDCQ